MYFAMIRKKHFEIIVILMNLQKDLNYRLLLSSFLGLNCQLLTLWKLKILRPVIHIKYDV